MTGHTGFKGAWLTRMLVSRGHTVSGLSLDPVKDSLFDAARIVDDVEQDLRCDIRQATAVTEAVSSIAPDVVLHLAAQALVRDSYLDPRGTFDTNVMGTLSVLEAVAATPSVRAAVIVTTDKVYRNVNQVAGYVEEDPLGGHDPYSSSKAMADILTQSWIASFPGAPTAIARAGNVIGGGDVSDNRLLPDLLRSFAAGTPARIRYPDSVRPWQHVLDCLNGYLTLADALLAGRGQGEWNFGPGTESFVPVSRMADLAVDVWGDGASWVLDGGTHPHEAGLLALDSSKAHRELGWSNRLPFPSSLEWTVEWQKAVGSGSSPSDELDRQIAEFEELR
ncbi:MAG: CDP-glucose 4,6-dehydratase [Pseudolysinimonas sp.]